MGDYEMLRPVELSMPEAEETVPAMSVPLECGNFSQRCAEVAEKIATALVPPDTVLCVTHVATANAMLAALPGDGWDMPDSSPGSITAVRRSVGSDSHWQLEELVELPP